ncbi:hypothetical protein AOQ84DRAFT_10949 [Glonium stellatum]|uniref:Oxidoreductase acuF-like C2H2 type zinc-finger domain-containing protein n=1 Tax=Glonium stellatum TaxID=574774 RepID=A0A8E2F3Y9_9PEZI|nr:hypothetical protein AOQ84DRAFT_10949 [Glonium stellatum]
MRRFKHRKRQHDRIAKTPKHKPDFVEPISLQSTPLQSTRSQIEQSRGAVDEQSSSQFPKAMITASAQPTQASITPTFKSELFNPPKSNISSVISSGTTLSAVGDVKFYWPGLPTRRMEDLEGNLVFECPYCFDTLEKEEALKKEKWRKHVKKDLEPYNCFHPECQSHLKMFTSDSEWLDHVRTKHATGKWVCRVKSHREALAFDNDDVFRSHLANEHEGAFPESRLHVLVKASYRPNKGPLFNGYPLGCAPETISPSTKVGIKQIDPLARHFANHLLSLAIEALPLRDDLKGSDTGEFEESSDSDAPESQRKKPLSRSDLSEVSVSGSWGSFGDTIEWEDAAELDEQRLEKRAVGLALSREAEGAFQNLQVYHLIVVFQKTLS